MGLQLIRGLSHGLRWHMPHGLKWPYEVTIAIKLSNIAIHTHTHTHNTRARARAHTHTHTMFFSCFTCFTTRRTCSVECMGRRLPSCFTTMLYYALLRFTNALLPGACAACNGWATTPSLPYSCFATLSYASCVTAPLYSCFTTRRTRSVEWMGDASLTATSSMNAEHEYAV